MSSKKGFNLFRKRKSKNNYEKDDLNSVGTEKETLILDKSQFSKSLDEEKVVVREMSDARFQELLDESRRCKSDWISQGREESEVDLWPVLKRETNILRLTNKLHPNQNQLKRLGTEISSIKIIAPALNTLTEIVESLKCIRESSKSPDLEERRTSPQSNVSASDLIVKQMEWMQKTEQEKLLLCKEFAVPQSVSIDENEEVNEDNIFYEQFLQWLQDASNHELFVRVKQFVTKINDIVPKLLPQEREMQTEMIAVDIKTFVNGALSGMEMSEEQRRRYTRYLRKFIMIMCYSRV